MQTESRKLLEDMRGAATQIQSISRTKTLDEYRADQPLRWSIERGFEIIGEALAQLAKRDAVLAGRITECREIISFRNILIHGYSRIDHDRAWRIVEDDLPVLIQEVEQLLSEP